jgi:hypothetical protein
MIIQIAIGFNCGFPQECAPALPWCASAPVCVGDWEMPAKRKSVVLF